MSQLTATADRVSDWAGLGIKFPQELTAAIATLDKVRYAEIGRQPTFDLGELGDDPEEFIADYAAKLVLAGANADQNSPLETAKREVMESSARAVVGQARAIIPVVIDSLQPKLAEVAEDFISAVNALPENLTAEALVQAGARAVEAYQRATGLADQLRRYDELVVSFGEIQGVLPKQYERTLRLLVPSPGQLSKLDGAEVQHRGNPVVVRLGSLFYTAAKLGVGFELKSMREAITLRNQLEHPQVQSFNR